MAKVDLSSLLGDTLLVHKDGNMIEVPTSTLNGKTVGIYFSAHWCPPCRGFTPRLRDLYKKLQKNGTSFEIVFVSSDRSPDQFEGYFQEMPWAAVPFHNSMARSRSAQTFGVMGIPCLSIVGPDGKVLCKNARGAAAADLEGVNFPWEGAEEPSMALPPILWVGLLLGLWYIYKWFSGRW